LLYLFLVYSKKPIFWIPITIYTTTYLYKSTFVLFDFFFGYFKIHPILFYIVINFSIYNIINFSFNNLKIKQFSIILLNIITFVLGSLWSLYQSIWGYYWTNDSIEYILLLILFFNLSKIHKNFTANYLFKNVLLLLILLLITLLRLKLIYTKHNFFIKKVIFHKTLLTVNFYFFVNYIFFADVKLPKNNKFKTLILISCLLIYNIIFNYLNTFILKTLFYFTFYFLVYVLTYNLLFNTFKKLLVHIIVIIFFIIYNNYSLNYLINKFHKKVFYFFYNNYFFKKNISSEVIINKYKNYFNFNFQKKKIIKINKLTNNKLNNKILVNFF
jgi:hypothetical protein